MLRANRIYETVIYADDLAAVSDFYQKVIGLPLLRQNDLMLVFQLERSYLLIFDSEKSSQSGRDVPSHGAVGQGHLAFVAAPEELDAWRQKLGEHNIPIESEVRWANGRRGTSIYFRDPGGNSVELAPEILWSDLPGP